MTTNTTRLYKCKDEELPVICEHVAYTLKRDSKDFSMYAPRFDQNYINQFDGKITGALTLVNPKQETAELKAITTRLYTTANTLTTPLNHLEGYIKLAGNKIPITPTDFGIIPLKRKINQKDMEGALQNLRLVISNITKYKNELTTEGMTDDLPAQLEYTATSIAADNELQYEILTQRMELVKNNLAVFNNLYHQLSEICEVGKMLYKQTSPEKTKEYTFAWLLKKVRHTLKNKTKEE